MYYSISFSQLCTYTNFNESERSFARRARYFRAVQRYLACLARKCIYSAIGSFMHVSFGKIRHLTAPNCSFSPKTTWKIAHIGHCWATKTRSREQCRRKASSAPNLIVRYQGPVKNLLCKADFAVLLRVQVRMYIVCTEGSRLMLLLGPGKNSH